MPLSVMKNTTAGALADLNFPSSFISIVIIVIIVAHCTPLPRPTRRGIAIAPQLASHGDLRFGLAFHIFFDS